MISVMQATKELLTPSHFTLVPPSSFLSRSHDPQDNFRPDGITSKDASSRTGVETTRDLRYGKVGAAKAVTATGGSSESDRGSTCTHLLPSSARSRDEEERMLSAWLPRKPSEVAACPLSHKKVHPSPRHSSERAATVAMKSDSKDETRRPAGCKQAEDRTRGGTRIDENTEELLARSLAQCHKIDKSLEFYAEVREKWREKPSRDRDRDTKKSACASIPTTPPHPDQASGRRAEVERVLTGRKTSKQVGGASKKSIREGSSAQKASELVTTTKRSRRRVTSQSPVNSTEKASRQPLNDLNSLPPRPKKEVSSSNTSTCRIHNPERGDAPRVTPEPSNRSTSPAEHVQKSAETPLTPEATQQTVTTPTQQKTACVGGLELEKAQVQLENTTAPDEEEFNDFDSVLQDSDSESVEPVRGTFGKPVLTGAQRVNPPLPSSEELHEPRQTCVPGTELEPELECRKKAFTGTHCDTELARVLQAEEESRAGVSLKPDTSNDLEIARLIQQQFNQEARVVQTNGRAAPAAEGQGEPGAMTYKSNFEGIRFLSDDPNYFERGYELGREFIVYDHNSPVLEQKEKNRNIPRKSIRRNNYSSRWDDEYRYRGFDERGYRNLCTERFQPYERKKWTEVGGTGIVTSCVRDMRRSDKLLEWEEQDLAFEGRQDLEEIESGLESKVIARISHEYKYKTTHRPKDPRVDPVTKCLVCLDDFHEGETLRLMPCAHTFHRFCIDKWLEENSDCPVCKADIVSLAEIMGCRVDREKFRKRYW